MNESGGASPFTILYSGGRLREPNPNIKVINGNRYWDGSLASFPDWAGATTGQLVSTAAGLCQDTRTTFREEAAGFGITDFTPPSQVEFNIKLARKVFKATSGGTELIAALKAGPSGLALIPTHLKSTWPGGCDSPEAVHRQFGGASVSGVTGAYPDELNLACERLVCSRCGSRRIGMVVSGTKRRRE
jgi:hypothetical protein